MKTVTATVSLDVHLTEAEREAVKKLLSQEGMEILKEARLVVSVRVEVKER